MVISNEKIYDSPPTDPEDTFWLEQGRDMARNSFEAVRRAATSLLTGLNLMAGVYLGILGFADYLPKSASLGAKSLFLLPLALWLVAVYHALQVLLTRPLRINLNSPDDIRENMQELLLEKQSQAQWAFYLLSAGLFGALLLFFLRPQLS